MLEFRLPAQADREAVLDFYREFEESGGTCIGFGGWRDYDRWLRGMQNRHTGENLPEGYVREDFCLCWEDGALVGVFSLKFQLTDYLLQFGGHAGYAVRPSRRRQGIASRMLAKGLEIARDFGMERLLCVCDEDNAASEEVILRNGGVLEDTHFDPEEGVTVKRYWIAL